MKTVLSTAHSERLHKKARKVLPMGVTGAERYGEPYPIVFTRGEGKWLTDVDGNIYLDYHCGFGTAILGYAHPEVDGAVRRAMRDVGTMIGVPHPYELELAERLCSLIPGADRVAFCGGGGSDAIYHAIRIARAATGRTKLLKVEGGYHGWHSDVGVSTRPIVRDPEAAGVLEGIPNSAGALEAVLDEVLVVSVNDATTLSNVFKERGNDIAAFLLEPVLYSPGCILVEDSYLQLARELCSAYSSVLIFDEVLTGFRNGVQGAGARAGVTSDLSVFGKAIANGYIMSVVAGTEDLMKYLAPEGPVFYSGTFNGHPHSLAAALATLEILERDDIAPRLWALGDRVADGINRAIRDLDAHAVCQAHGSVWSLYFNTHSVRTYREYARTLSGETASLYDEFHLVLRERGIFIPRRHAPRAFVSARHDDDDIDRTVDVVSAFLESRCKATEMS